MWMIIGIILCSCNYLNELYSVFISPAMNMYDAASRTVWHLLSANTVFLVTVSCYIWKNLGIPSKWPCFMYIHREFH